MSHPTCACGATKDHPSHIACNTCMDKVAPELRAKFFDLARHKRGSPSYHATVRDVTRAVLANVDAAKAGRVTA